MGQLSEHEGRYGQETHTSLEATDASSFDDLAKGLATGTLSRGRALRMLGAALMGGALASIPGVAWAAKPGGCASGVTCKGKCCPVGATCGTGKGGGCACPTGQMVCGGQCVSLTTNQNCGSCGNACQEGKTCQGGVCACPQGQTECGGVCRDLATDVLNCGLCGSACGTGQSCVGGQCACPSGQELCGGQCVHNLCTEEQPLNPTTCRCECPTETTLCYLSNTCVQSNCPEGQVFNPYTCTCENGVCVDGTNIGCPSGQGCCRNSTPEGTPACTSCGHCNSCRYDEGSYFNPTTCQCECLPGLVGCFGNDGASCCPPGATCGLKSVPGGASFAGCCPSGTHCNTSGETLVCE